MSGHDNIDAIADDRTIVVVAGATSSIGAGVLRSLRDGGSHVVALAHRPAAIAVDGIDLVLADTTTPHDITSIAERLTAAYPRVDGLVCLVSGFSGGIFIQPGHAQAPDMVDLNVGSATALVQELLPGMRQRGSGRVVSVVTRPSIALAPTSVAYAAARASIIGITRSLAATLHGTGVTINCLIADRVSVPSTIAPGGDRVDALGVSPEQIGDIIGFLCSEAAGVIQGAAIPLEPG